MGEYIDTPISLMLSFALMSPSEIVRDFESSVHIFGNLSSLFLGQDYHVLCIASNLARPWTFSDIMMTFCVV